MECRFSGLQSIKREKYHHHKLTCFSPKERVGTVQITLPQVSWCEFCRVCANLVQCKSMHLNLGWDSCVQGQYEVHLRLTWALILSMSL